MSDTPVVSIIVPAYNLWRYTSACLDAIARHTQNVPLEVLVVDDASTDETRIELPRRTNVVPLRNPQNVGFARSNNHAAARARGRYLLFLNNDTEVAPGWLPPLLTIAENDPRVGMVGSKLLFPNGTIQHAGVALSYGAPEPITPFHLDYARPASVSTEVRELRAVTAACCLMPRALFAALGGFDEAYLNGYEDVDLCLKVGAAGHRIVYTPHSQALHHESLSDGRWKAVRRHVERLHDVWYPRLEAAALGRDPSALGYDFDYRRLFPPARRFSARPGVSVVVVVSDNISTVVPTLESVRAAAAEQDELIIVDNGSRGATRTVLAAFAARNAAERVHLERCAEPVSFPAAAARGVERAGQGFVAVLGAAQKVLPGWLDRLVPRLMSDAGIGVIAPGVGAGFGVPAEPLLVPLPPERGALALPAETPAMPQATIPTSVCALGARDRIARLAARDALFGRDPEAIAHALASEGTRLVRADDTPVFPLDAAFPEAGPALRTAYLRGSLTAAHGGLAAVVTVHGHADALTSGLRALLATAPVQELIIAESGSPDAQVARVLDAFRRSPGVRLRHVTAEPDEGFAGVTNRALALVTTDDILMLAADALVTDGAVARMRAALHLSAEVGLAAPSSNSGVAPQRTNFGFYDDPQAGGDSASPQLTTFAAQWALDHYGEFGTTLRASAACLALKRTTLERIGGFDPSYGEPGGELDDFLVRLARAGLRLVIARDAFVHHSGLWPSRLLDLNPKKPPPAAWARLCARWQHPPAAVDAAGMRALFASGGWHPTRDRIPLDPHEVFRGPPGHGRILCVAEVAESAWLGDVRAAVHEAHRRGVGLTVLVDPPTPVHAQTVADGLHEVVEQTAVDVVIDAAPYAYAERGALYAAHAVLFASSGPRAAVHRREARLSGLPIGSPDGALRAAAR